MKKILDKIEEKWGKNAAEILLTVVFVCVFAVLCGPQIIEDTKAVLGRNVNSPNEERDAATESETWESLEREGLSESLEDETQQGIPLNTKTEDEKVSGKETETEAATGKGTEEEAVSGNKTEAGAANGKGTEEETVSGKEAEDKVVSEKETKKETSLKISEKEEGLEEGANEVLPKVYELKDSMTIARQQELLCRWARGRKEEIPEKDYDKIMEGLPLECISVLEKMIEDRIEQYDGEWSVYVKNLSTDESIVINDQPMKSASVMKLFIMGTVYTAFDDGSLERTEETMSLLDDMITASDNEASNQLLYLLGESSYERGIEKVDEFIREYGFSDMTVEYNGFNNSSTVMDSSRFNQVSAKDCGKLLEDIYHRTWVTRKVSNEMEGLLLNQHTRYKIPAGLPEGVLCGNKTGEMDTTENDAAIIYGEACDYILVVLSSDWNSKDEAIFRIASISAMVYGYLN